MKKQYTPVFGLAMLLLSYSQVQAQSVVAVQYRPIHGLSDPELPDPRYAGALEVGELKEQVQALTDAYSRLIQEHNLQADRIQSLERLLRAVGPPPARSLSTSPSFRKL